MADMTTGTLAAPAFAFFQRRWHGAVSRQRLFWWDMLSVATLLNATLGMLSLILLTRGMEGSTWLLLHLFLLPYNLFLVAALWRKDDAGQPMRLTALVWLAMTVAI
jgi:hypothetical protein